MKSMVQQDIVIIADQEVLLLSTVARAFGIPTPRSLKPGVPALVLSAVTEKESIFILATSAEMALDAVKMIGFPIGRILLLVSGRLPETERVMSGWGKDLIRQLRDAFPNKVTGYLMSGGGSNFRKHAREVGAEFVEKPFREGLLRDILQKFFQLPPRLLH